MEIDKLQSIKISLMESQGEPNKESKTNYILRSHALITVNDLVIKTIKEHGIENVLESVYNELLEVNNDPVDSVGVWAVYDGKEFESSIKIQTLKDMEEHSTEEVSPIYEFFMLMSSVADQEDESVV